jgi:tRNA pseudouridine38-40 synthase
LKVDFFFRFRYAKCGDNMKNYKLTIQYDGARYRGWQVQGNTENTIQGKLQLVLSQLDGAPVEVHGSGRTDAGVHAKGQVASVKLTSDPDCQAILDYCAAHLPQDIAVIAAEPADARFHARLNAKSKRYIYRIWNSAVPNVFERKYVYQLSEVLNLDAMERAATLLVGTHDFRSFCGLRRFKKSTIRTIYSIKIQSIGDEVRISYEGDGFLNLMVRILTGTLIEVGLGKRQPEGMTAILDAKDRSAAGITMPPEGLCLDAVFYE